MNWFSTKVRLVCLLEGAGGTRYMDSVHLFRAKDSADAHGVALKLGREHEDEYRNSEGETVRWRLKEIVSLDCLGAELVDGVEVYSEPVALETDVAIDFDDVFHPEKSEPTQTV